MEAVRPGRRRGVAPLAVAVVALQAAGLVVALERLAGNRPTKVFTLATAPGEDLPRFPEPEAAGTSTTSTTTGPISSPPLTTTAVARTGHPVTATVTRPRPATIPAVVTTTTVSTTPAPPEPTTIPLIPPSTATCPDPGDPLRISPYHPQASGIYVIAPDGSGARRIDLPAALLVGGAVRFSPDGRRLSFQAYRESKGGIDLYLVAVDGTGLLEVTGVELPSTTPGWSPDGRHLAVADTAQPGKTLVMLVDAATGDTRPLATVPFGISDLAWSPDGTRIAFSGNVEHPGLYMLTVASGEVRRIVAENASVSWSPDSRRLVAARPGYGGSFVVNADGSFRHDHSGTANRAEWSPTSDRIATSDGVSTRVVQPDGKGCAVSPTAAVEDWSPDGLHLLATGIRGIDYDWDLHLVPASGGPGRVLVESIGDLYVLPDDWSGDGSLIAFRVLTKPR